MLAEAAVTHDAPAVAVAALRIDFPLERGRTVTALGPIDLDVAAGSFVAIVGPSGCGKSTLLRAVAGLTQPTAGTVRVADSEPATLIARHQLGIAFQDHALLPWLSVRENIALPFHLAHRSVDAARIEELIALVGLEEFAGARPRQLSGGMRQRVAIARALVLRPRILLLDEPFGALDALTRLRMQALVHRLWQDRGFTVVLVTHDVEEAVLLADRVIVLDNGAVADHFSVDLPRPRARRDPRFESLRVRILDDLGVSDIDASLSAHTA
jgi:NitT/TauT family transport system ATP-binding protein